MISGQDKTNKREYGVSVYREVGQNCACFALRKASRAVTQHYDHYLARLGLKTTQFTLLNSVAGYQPVSVNDLAGALAMDRTTLTRNVKLLLEQDLIAQQADKSDKRIKQLRLTRKGLALFEQALPLWREAHADFLAKVSDKAWAHLSSDLRLVQKAMTTGIGS